MKLCPAYKNRPAAFTLVEILIVVVIISILAAISLPQFSDATNQTKESMLRENLRIMRTQIQTYSAQHVDEAPGYDASGTPDAASFTDQMTKFTDALGTVNNVGTADYPFGPYLSKIPENPLNGLDTINIVADGAALPGPADTHGWIYKPLDGIFKADLTGVDKNSEAYYDY